MPKSANQKLKILYIVKFLYEETDEDHTLSIYDIIDKLEKVNISAARRSITDDICALQDFGFNIVKERGKCDRYFLASRLFENAELQVLIDSIQATHFISKKKSETIIKNLMQLTSREKSHMFLEQLCFYDRVKSDNERIYYNVDALQNAIFKGRKASFKYFDYNIKREKIFRRDGGDYIVNPVALNIDGEYYYLITYSEKYDDFIHYRIDKITDVEILEESRAMPKKKFNTANYIKPIFSMYNGETESVTVRFYKWHLNTVLDRFGKDVFISVVDENYFDATFKAAISPVFLSWIIGFGSEAKVISPKRVADKVKELALDTAKMYDD